MIHKNRLLALILWIAAALLCIVVCRAATDETHNLDEKRATLTVESISVESISDGGWHVVLRDLPVEARRVALMVELVLPEGDLVPRLTLTEEAAAFTLTVGIPVHGRVRLLVDGRLPEGHGGAVRLLRVERLYPSDAGDAPRLEAVEGGTPTGGLWLMDADGYAAAHPLLILGADTDAPTATDAAETLSETLPETASSTAPESPSETSVGTRPHAEPETLAEVETLPPPAARPDPDPEIPRLPDFVGCGEVVVGERGFSVELLFWGGEDSRAPATVCMGGGQEVTLTARWIGGTSAVIYTYRGLRTEGECRIYVFTEEGVVTLRLRDGAVVE